jgi:predicted AAA+ superfamily ATPase
MAELGLRAGTIVTRDEEETIPVGAGSIDVVPAWRFLLNVG